jgi:HTH-type transcriptional regulator / antitoxin HigA
VLESGQVIPTRVPSPGEVLRHELEARGWTQADLAAVTGRPAQAVNEIVKGKKEVTPETALALAAALGTSAELWLNLESKYRLHRAQQDRARVRQVATIARRGRLQRLVPLKELVRRGWIRKVSALGEVEREVCSFLGLRSIDDEPSLAASFRHSQVRRPEPGPQLAWVKRVEQLAIAQTAPRFDARRLEADVPSILAHACRVEDAPVALDVLREHGVRVVLLKHVEKSYVDGAAFWLDDGAPVIALSLRYDRIDAFWFTLMHEVAHLLDSRRIAHLDVEDDEESDADTRAKDWLVSKDAYRRFTEEGRFTEASVASFASALARHPGIVVGRLHHDGVVPFSRFRGLLPRVSPHLDVSL